MEIEESTDSAQILITVNELGYQIDLFDGVPLNSQAIDVESVMFECRDCDKEINLVAFANMIKRELRNETKTEDD